MSRYIDADKLKVAIHEKSFDSGLMNPIFTYIEVMQLMDNAEPISLDRIKGVVPLDRIKQAREDVAKYQSIHDNYCEHIEKGDFWEGHTPNHYESSGGKATACDYFLQILDKLIAEAEETKNE